MRVLLATLLLVGCHREFDVPECAHDANGCADTETAEETGTDSVSVDSEIDGADACECSPGEVVPVTGTCPGVLEKKTKTCTSSCVWSAETCALPKGWTAIADPPTGFQGRLFAASAWTGGELIVHGGQQQPDGGPTFSDGAIYSIVKNAWTLLPTTGAPTARGLHTGVWNGLEFIVWGGADGTNYRSDGAIYDAFSKSWRPLPAAPLTGRSTHGAVWIASSSEMIVWGGRDDAGYTADGATFSSAGGWTKLPASPIAARALHVMMWTGKEVLVWGGTSSSGRLNDGALYDPAKKSWRSIPAAPVAGRIFSSAFVVGDRFVFFGGVDSDPLHDGASLSLSDLTWTKIDGPVPAIYETRGVPVAWQHGTDLFFWSGAGGVSTTPTLLTSAASYDVMTSIWSAIPMTGAPAPRMYATSAATSFGGIVWSGIGKPGGIFEVLADGAIYVP